MGMVPYRCLVPANRNSFGQKDAKEVMAAGTNGTDKQLDAWILDSASLQGCLDLRARNDRKEESEGFDDHTNRNVHWNCGALVADVPSGGLRE